MWRVRCAYGSVASRKRSICCARERRVGVGRREVAHQPDDVRRRLRQLGEPPAPHPGVELQVHRDAVGDLAAAGDDELEPRLARLGELVGRAHHDDPRVGKLAPQLDGFGDSDDAERRRPGLERRPTRRPSRRGRSRSPSRRPRARHPSSASSSRRALWRIAPRSIVISLRCMRLVSRESARQRLDHVARDEAVALRRFVRARAAARRSRGRGGARCGSMPFARNAAMTPVRTSPVPAVASDGRPQGADERRRGPARDERVRALEDDDAAGSAPPPPAPSASRCAAIPSTRAPSRRASSPSCGVRTRRRGALARLELGERVGVDDRRQISISASRRPDERLRLVPAEPGADRERASPWPPRRRRRSSGRFTASSTSVSSTGQRLGRAPRSSRSRRRRGTRRGPRARRRRSCRGSRRRRARSPRVYLLSSGALRGTRPGSPAVTRRARSRAGSRPMSATTTSPARKRPGATASADLRRRAS